MNWNNLLQCAVYMGVLLILAQPLGIYMAEVYEGRIQFMAFFEKMIYHFAKVNNPMKLPGVSPNSSFNTAVSFASNTNWQGYSGEATMSYLTQMLGLGV